MHLKKRTQAEQVFREASALSDKGRYRQAFTLFRRAAEAGHAGSRVNVGFFYDKGLAIKRDVTKAIYWYSKAARQGESSAAYNIASLYVERGKLQDAVKWFKRAADLGEVDALVDLGALYKTQLGKPAKARNYVLKALESDTLSAAALRKAKRVLRTKRQS
jgi:TPR repeat protein